MATVYFHINTLVIILQIVDKESWSVIYLWISKDNSVKI